MPKGWAASRSVRWLAGGIAAIVLGLAIVWVLFVPAADWLARHDMGSVTGLAHETAVDNARGRLLTLGAGLFAAGALVFTALTFNLSQRTFAQADRAQVTDRYTKAVEQLGSDKMDVKVGAIYSLEHVAKDSDEYHRTVIEVLSAFIRVNSQQTWPENAKEEDRSTRPDVQAALTVLGRRDVERDAGPIDLFEAILFSANLNAANLHGVTLRSANLTRAFLVNADLTCADLREVILQDARLDNVNFADAQWSENAPPPRGWKLVPGRDSSHWRLGRDSNEPRDLRQKGASSL